MIAFSVGSICFGIAMQWIWIMNECDLDNLWVNNVKKCQDNRLRLALGGPLALLTNLILFWLCRIVLNRHAGANARSTKRGLLLALSAPGLLALVVPAGVRWLEILAISVFIVEVFIFFRYLHQPVIASADTLLGYFEAGVRLQAVNATLEVSLTDARLGDEWLIARRRILACLKQQKFTAMDVRGATPHVLAPRLISWLQKTAKKSNIQLSIRDLET